MPILTTLADHLQPFFFFTYWIWQVIVLTIRMNPCCRQARFVTWNSWISWSLYLVGFVSLPNSYAYWQLISIKHVIILRISYFSYKKNQFENVLCYAFRISSWPHFFDTTSFLLSSAIFQSPQPYDKPLPAPMMAICQLDHAELQWNLNQNLNISINTNASGNVIHKITGFDKFSSV